jgi:hypothetical protein
MKNTFYFFLFSFMIYGGQSNAQSKRDYQWIIGYPLQNSAKIINLNFLGCQPDIYQPPTPEDSDMEGANTSLSDEQGNLLFYCNGCFITNKIGTLMQNGNGINPGYMEDLYCPYGGSPYIQGTIALPAPGSDSLCYVFNLDMSEPYGSTDTFLDLAPERLYYQLIDMSANGGLGKVIQKNQIAILDTLARGNVKAVQHANGLDWWVIVPKSNSNCYFLSLVTAQGVSPTILKCVGTAWYNHDLGTQTVFSPNGTKYIRCNKEQGLHIFDFDNNTGELSNPVVIQFPNDTFTFGGVSVSSNSRLLYVSAGKKLFQFDLWASNIEASKTTVGQWDGVQVSPTNFYISALAPDNKIYISGTSSHKFLHIIHSPDNLGMACNVEIRGLALPAYNFATIPNLPHYRTGSTDCVPVGTISVEYYDRPKVYPNPTRDIVVVELPTWAGNEATIDLFAATGRFIRSYKIINSSNTLDCSMFQPGVYFYYIRNGSQFFTGKIVIVE